MSVIVGLDIHGKSGNVALPRTKLVPASPACFEVVVAPARRAERTVDVRRRDVDMLKLLAWVNKSFDVDRLVE